MYKHISPYKSVPSKRASPLTGHSKCTSLCFRDSARASVSQQQSFSWKYKCHCKCTKLDRRKGKVCVQQADALPLGVQNSQVLNMRLNMGGPGGASYYAFAPHPAWRIIVLDGYDVSLLGWPADHPLHQQALSILDERNPNQVCNFSRAFTWEHQYMSLSSHMRHYNAGLLTTHQSQCQVQAAVEVTGAALLCFISAKCLRYQQNHQDCPLHLMRVLAGQEQPRGYGGSRSPLRQIWRGCERSAAGMAGGNAGRRECKRPAGDPVLPPATAPRHLSGGMPALELRGCASELRRCGERRCHLLRTCT